jgi:hypothetical protein
MASLLREFLTEQHHAHLEIGVDVAPCAERGRNAGANQVLDERLSRKRPVDRPILERGGLQWKGEIDLFDIRVGDAAPFCSLVQHRGCPYSLGDQGNLQPSQIRVAFDPPDIDQTLANQEEQ